MHDSPEPHHVGSGEPSSTPPPGEQPATGQHTLGPHVVGTRVVVRRLLRDPDGTVRTGATGGPAFTDLLGVCTAWGDGRCRVRPTDGPEQDIPLADIVSGKPVPPRPSRFRRVSAADAESHVAALWPHLEVEPLGGWVLRSDPAPTGRLRRRANSCLAMAEAELPTDVLTERIVRFYAERDRPVWAHVEAGGTIEAELRASGWHPLGDGDAHFMIAALPMLRRRLRGLAEEPDLTVDRREEANAVTVRLVPADAPVPDHPSAARAIGEASYDRDWMGLHGLWVAEAHRRRGLAHRVLDELLEWGAERGAGTVWLHVETDNAAALGLYEGLGFELHHTARYLARG